MKPSLKKGFVLILSLALAISLCSCMITSGTFFGIKRSYSDTSLQASFKSFDGSLTRRMKLKAGEVVTFSYRSDCALTPVVEQGGEEIFDITDGSTFTVPGKGTYDFTVKGSDTDGYFSLTWVVQ